MTRWAKDVTPDKPLPEYPRPQMVRPNWVNLNGLWGYAIAPKADAVPAAYQGKILVPFPVESALSGVMKMVGAENKLWYRKTFETPKEAANQRLLLHFGAVDWQTTVWLNGKEIGAHQGGYDPFTFDLTDALKPTGPQELIVAVWDPSNDGPQPRGKQVKKPGGIFYTPVTGIWQTVWLEAVPKQYIRGLKITPDVDNTQVKIEVDSTAAQSTVTILDGEKEIASSSGANAITIKFPSPKLWSGESPFLYNLRIKSGDDAVESYFGMRKIEVEKDDKGVSRIYLNNNAIFMAGPLDQGFWPDGIYTAPTDEALKYDLEITKKLGFNCTRKHVKVEPARWYYHCDKMGMLVWQDMPSGDKSVGPNKGEVTRTADAKKIYESELKTLIDTNYNSPSIIMWVVFNEGWGQFDTVRITDWTKKYDPTRLINPASGWNDFPAGDVIDMHHYPNPAAPKPQETRASVLGEFGGLGLPTPGHMWADKNWGYKGVSDGKALTRQYVKLMSNAWKLRETEGLNAAIYTQITDVETEANGLLTYDRAVIKVDVDAVAQANQGKAKPPEEIPQKTILPTSEKQPQTWRYTIEKPADDNWFKPDFNDTTWKSAPGGFGTQNTPGATVRTEWKTADIWIRQSFELKDAPTAPLLIMHHDEDAEVYLNGVPAAKATGFIGTYEEFDLTKEAKATLKPGKNTIAVHCHQTTGGQYIDVGIVDTK
ncbi:MAG: beta-galactosidase/beta-glucuronidase, partial [Phycisphaerales bacterium]|nr:beta-galactosidase/beta-glucuronidase [Phycisphaerales bacterium]